MRKNKENCQERRATCGEATVATSRHSISEAICPRAESTSGISFFVRNSAGMSSTAEKYVPSERVESGRRAADIRSLGWQFLESLVT